MLCLSINNIATIIVKLKDIWRNSFVRKLCAWWLWVYINIRIQEKNIKNWIYNYYLDNLIKTKNIGTKNIFINEKNCKGLVIYFTRYVHSQSMIMLSWYYNELIGKAKEYEDKNYLIIDDYMLDKVLDKIKEIIGMKKFDNSKILIDTDDKSPDDNTFKIVVIFMTCVTK